MRHRQPHQSWSATIIFYLVLLLVITLVDWINNILMLDYWGIQVGLITVGIILFVLIGRWSTDLSSQRGVLLAFSIGILTIIPAVLMVFNPPGEFWGQYFTVGLSMAAGSLLGFVFIRLVNKVL